MHKKSRRYISPTSPERLFGGASIHTFVYTLVWFVALASLHLLCFASLFVRRVRQRFRFFYGTDQAVLEALESTVAPENLPPPMGQKPLDFQGWLAERIKAET